MYRALIVDDEYYIRHGLENTIQWDEYGIEVVGSATNGIEALEYIARSKPHIVITDVKMPDMNGIELLKEIRKTSDDIKVIIISGFNDFEYVKEALLYGVENYILKPINEDELSDTLLNTLSKIESEQKDNTKSESYSDFIKDNLFCRLVTNSISHKEAQERLNFLGIDLDAEGYVVGIIKIISYNGEKSNINSIRYELLSLLRNNIDNFIRSHLFCDLDGNIVVLFCKSNTHTYNQIEAIMQNLIACSNRELNCEVFVTVGNETEDITEVYKSYFNAQELQKYTYIYPANSRISYHKVKLAKERLDDIIKIDIDLLRDNLLGKNIDGTVQYYQELKNNLISSCSVHLEHVRSCIIEIAAGLISIIKEKNLRDGNIIDSNQLFEKLFQQTKLDNTINWLKEISLNIINELAKMSRKPKTLVESIIEYLENNFGKEISLKTISIEFYVNPSYLGQAFKNETGKLFSDYLNGLRIEKAKEMLENTNMKANQIAKKVGYIDPNYFYKVFKKYTGVYPLDYKTNDNIVRK